MKQNNLLSILFFCTIFLLFTACQSLGQSKPKPSPTVPITVSLNVLPATPKPNQPVHFTVLVKQGETMVKDSIVKVEIRVTGTIMHKR